MPALSTLAHRSLILAAAVAASLAASTFAQTVPAASTDAMATTEPTTMATTTPSTTASRTIEAIMQDVQTASQEMGSALGSMENMFDPAKRSDIGTKAVPTLNKLKGYSVELSNLDDPRGKAIGKQVGNQAEFFLALFGDADATAAIDARTKSTDEHLAKAAKTEQLQLRWILSGKDAPTQGKVLDDAVALVKASPEDHELAGVIKELSSMPAASPDIAERAKKAADEIEASMPPKSLENKPLAIAGTTPDGKAFTTADWKGKVILVDFWATWCGPCLEELPRVKKAYADFHAKGLEVLGVSNDFEQKALTDFVAKDPGMPWTQLFDAKAAGAHQWNPITEGYGIDGIPTMFLIDKKGVLRSVDARENFEEQIPKLLDEKAE